MAQAVDRLPELSIVMPCLNEAETIAACIREAQAFLQRTGTAGEIVVGDNGSSDGSPQIAAALGARVIHVPLRGYGAAVFGAVNAARGRYCIMGDADASYDFSDLGAFVAKLREGHDLVMGNRLRNGIRPGAMPWKNRHFGNPILSALGRLLFHAPTGDVYCGLRGFTKAAFVAMDCRSVGMVFAVEMVIKATLLEMKIAEVPTVLRPDGRSRPPHLRPWRDGWSTLRFMLLFSPNWLFFYPGLVVAATGAALGGALLWGSLHIRHVHFDLDTLIYCNALLVGGVQAMLFSNLSRRYAVQQGLYPDKGERRGAQALWTLERGLGVGFALLSAGVAAAFWAVWQWKQASFGPLDIESIARIVIPSATAISLGIEIVLFSFLLSTFELRIRPLDALVGQLRPYVEAGPAPTADASAGAARPTRVGTGG